MLILCYHNYLSKKANGESPYFSKFLVLFSSNMEMSASFIQSIFWRFTTLVLVKWSCLLVIYKEIACNIYNRSWNFSEALIITTFPDAVCVCETYHLSVLQLLPCWRLLAERWFGFLCLSLHSGNTVIARTGFRSSDARGKWCPSFSETGIPI